MRRVNRIASGVLGLVLIAAGLLVALEMALIAFGRTPVWLPLDQWYRTLGVTSLANRGVLATAIVVGIIGLVILVLELRPWAPDRVLAGDSTESPWWMSRRSVERRTAIAVDDVAGVSRARVKVRGRALRWRLRLRADGTTEQREAVVEAVRHELERLSVPSETTVDVALHPPAIRRVA